MKNILMIALMVITTYGAQAQNQFADYVGYLKDKEGNKQEMIQMPDPHNVKRFEWHMFPRPIEIKKTHTKVIVVFDRKEWERMRLMQHRRWVRPNIDRKKTIPGF